MRPQSRFITNNKLLCSNCKQHKPVSEFYKNGYTATGHGSWCKRCYSPTREDRKKLVTHKIKIYFENHYD